MATVLTRGPWMCRLRPQQRDVVQRSSAPSDVLTRAAAELGAGAVQWAVEAAGTLLAAMRQGAADLGGGPSSPRGIETELLSLLLQLKEGRPADELQVSEAALDDARTLARGGVPAVVLVEAVWRLHVLVQDAMLSTAAVDGWDGDSQRDDLSCLARYSELAARRLLDAHAAESTAWADARHARQRVVVGRLVKGEVVGNDDVELLGARLDGHHLLTTVTDDAGHAVPVDDTRLVEVAKAVSTSLPGCYLVSSELVSETVLWWSRAHPLTGAEVDSLREIEVPHGLTVAVGDPQSGPTGVALGFAEARRAAGVAARSARRRLCLHRDALLAATVLADPVAARVLVARELAGVLGQDERSTELRQTVLMFLRSGGSRKAVAQQLEVAPTTVAYRVERFELLRGWQLDVSRLETWIALDIVERVPTLLDEAAGRPVVVGPIGGGG